MFCALGLVLEQPGCPRRIALRHRVVTCFEVVMREVDRHSARVPAPAQLNVKLLRTVRCPRPFGIPPRPSCRPSQHLEFFRSKLAHSLGGKQNVECLLPLPGAKGVTNLRKPGVATY